MSNITATSRVTTDTRPIYLYFGPLTLLVYMALPDGYILDIGTSYMLKNQLHATATETATFRLLTAIPIYLAFVFGMCRDLWNPFGMKDRGFFLLFAPMGTAALLWMAFTPLSYAVLVTGMLLLAISYRFIVAAYQGLLALVGQEQQMSGRLSVVYNAGSFLCYFAGALACGYITEHLSSRQIFILAAVLTALITVLGLWKPRVIFGHVYSEPQAQGAGLIGDLKRLARHRAIYPAILIIFLFAFVLVTSTPLQFYLTNHLHASDAAFADFTAINLLSFVPTVLLYSYLCKRVALKTLLWWATILAIPQLVPLALASSANAILLAAVPMGLLSGLGQAAYIDLAMRSCPAGLQGTLMMLVTGAYVLALRGGDVLGSWIYASSPAHGFFYGMLAGTAASVLILPVLRLIPEDVIATADGERTTRERADLAAPITSSAAAVG
jgi:MFS family permease